jgi:wobble nucleotide-excising tRNase
MNELIPIKDNLGLFRDPKTNSILNSSVSEYENYLILKKKKENESTKIKNIESEVNQIKNDINEIKNLLKSLSEKNI